MVAASTPLEVGFVVFHSLRNKKTCLEQVPEPVLA
jgi:hypothetical protein